MSLFTPSCLRRCSWRVSTFVYVACSLGAGLAAAESGQQETAVTRALYQLASSSGPAEPGLAMLRRDAAPDNGWQDVALGAQRSALRYGVLPGIPSLRVRQDDMGSANAWLESRNWFAGAGLGQALLRPDGTGAPRSTGDVYMLRGGYAWHGRESLSLQLVRDSRQPQGDQRTVQLLYGAALAGNEMFSVGVSSISGLAWGTPVQRIGLSIGYDWPRYFVQLAYDPKVLMPSQELLRLSAGTRF